MLLLSLSFSLSLSVPPLSWRQKVVNYTRVQKSMYQELSREKEVTARRPTPCRPSDHALAR